MAIEATGNDLVVIASDPRELAECQAATIEQVEGKKQQMIVEAQRLQASCRAVPGREHQRQPTEAAASVGHAARGVLREAQASARGRLRDRAQLPRRHDRDSHEARSAQDQGRQLAVERGALRMRACRPSRSSGFLSARAGMSRPCMTCGTSRASVRTSTVARLTRSRRCLWCCVTRSSCRRCSSDRRWWSARRGRWAQDLR